MDEFCKMSSEKAYKTLLGKFQSYQTQIHFEVPFNEDK